MHEYVRSPSIKSIGSILNDSFRTEDVVACLGGDEFGILLPEVNQSDCQVLLERLRDNIEIYNRSENIRRVEIAIGAATSIEHEDLHLLFKRADEQMYAEKMAYKKQLGSDTV